MFMAFVEETFALISAWAEDIVPAERAELMIASFAARVDDQFCSASERAEERMASFSVCVDDRMPSLTDLVEDQLAWFCSFQYAEELEATPCARAVWTRIAVMPAMVIRDSRESFIQVRVKR